MRHNILLFVICFLFLFLFFINLKGCKKIKENFEDSLSTTINTNKDSIDSIKKKLNLIQTNTNNILKNSDTLLFKSQSNSKSYNDLLNKSEKNIKNGTEINYDVNALKIFKLLQNIDEKELLSVIEIVKTNMTDSQKQILDEYVNVSINNNTINNSLKNLNSK